MGAPREVAFFPCPDVSLPLRSPEVSALHSVVFFSCPDGSPLVGDPREVAFFPTQQALTRTLTAMHRPHARPRHVVAVPTCSPYFAIGPGLQRLGCCSGGFSAPPADPTPAVPLAMASAVPTTGSALPRPCMSTLEGSPSPVSYRQCQRAWEGQEIQEAQVHWPLLTALPLLPPDF